jgi:hypothetical protein
MIAKKREGATPPIRRRTPKATLAAPVEPITVTLSRAAPQMRRGLLGLLLRSAAITGL